MLSESSILDKEVLLELREFLNGRTSCTTPESSMRDVQSVSGCSSVVVVGELPW